MGILEKMRLDGKSIFVTGGARGIGMNYAKAVAEAGADVAIVDMDLETAERTAATLAAETGRRFLAIRCDVTDEESVHAMMDTFLAAFGKLDAAFCNAGICTNVPAEEMSYACWKKVIDVNLNGMFLTNQAAGRQMLKQGYGSIINTASMSAHIVNVPQPQCHYNASKAGVIQLTKSLAIEWATLIPLIEKWNELAPLHRLGKPEELQAIAVYLAGDASSFTTGSDFVIDGAFTCF